VAVVVAVGTAVVEEEVAAGSPLDHGEVLEHLSQPVDPEGETIHARVLVHIMMRLDVDDELSVVEERFLIGVVDGPFWYT
jgi:hypothetical protein